MVLPLAMGWRHLLFANYPVEPAVVDAHLPDELTLDTFDGDAWLSVVPFTNVDVRPDGLPASAGFDLPELNLRTYVTRDGEPGVYFFSLDAQGVFGVLGARIFHHLPYFYARISLDYDERTDRIRYESHRLHPGDRPANYVVSYGPTGDPFRSSEEPLAEFLVERYRFYTQGRDGSVRYADIEHDTWTLAPATMTVEENTLFRADGFADPDREPVCYYGRGVDVVASASKRWHDERSIPVVSADD